jgi:hypothetical protein
VPHSAHIRSGTGVGTFAVSGSYVLPHSVQVSVAMFYSLVEGYNVRETPITTVRNFNFYLIIVIVTSTARSEY